MIETIMKYGLEVLGFCVLFVLFVKRVIPWAVTLLGLQKTPDELMKTGRGKLAFAGFIGLLISAFVSFAIIYYIDKAISGGALLYGIGYGIGGVL